MITCLGSLLIKTGLKSINCSYIIKLIKINCFVNVVTYLLFGYKARKLLRSKRGKKFTIESKKKIKCEIQGIFET